MNTIVCWWSLHFFFWLLISSDVLYTEYDADFTGENIDFVFKIRLLRFQSSTISLICFLNCLISVGFNEILL